MIWLLYFTLMYFMVLGIRLSSLWNAKAALWISGRKNWKRSLEALPPKQSLRIWFHVSSLGEFEQARPVIEELKKTHPELEILLTFFSPSGYEIRKSYSLAKVSYLPADLPGHAKQWVRMVRPDLAIFVKYDLWPGYLHALVKEKIPFLIISALFKPGGFSSWSVPPASRLLKHAKCIFLQDETYVEVLKHKGFHNLQVAGDTRIDRTLTMSQEVEQHTPELLRNAAPFDLIAGSTWEEDEKLLIPLIEELNLKVIIAPHDVSETNVTRLIQQIHVPCKRFSQITSADVDIKVVVIDNIGLLSYLYSLGKLAYIGGGFRKGIHNILEPAAHGIPVLIGPKYHKFPEAEGMIKSEAVISIKNMQELREGIVWLSGEKGKRAGREARAFLEKNQGATQIVTTYIRESIPFGAKS